MPPKEIIFDGHNDVLLSVRQRPGKGRWFLQEGTDGHLDVGRARTAGFGGGLFAVFIPGPHAPLEDLAVETESGYEVPPLDAVDPDRAWEEAITGIATLHRLARESNGSLEVVRDIDALKAALAAGRLAAVLHLEGAEPLKNARHMHDRLEILYAAGLRSVGIVWSRPNAFGHGVPFRYPASPDTGAGLTSDGRRLVRFCNRLGILIDLAHLNAKGFRDVSRVSAAPLVASHTAAHSITPSSRNLLDWQLDAVGATGGVIGLNFNVRDIRPDGRKDIDTPLDAFVAHAAYISDRIGIDHIALGSDFDGAPMARELADVTCLPRLIEALRTCGFDDSAVRKIAHENWIRVLGDTWSGAT